MRQRAGPDFASDGLKTMSMIWLPRADSISESRQQAEGGADDVVGQCNAAGAGHHIDDGEGRDRYQPDSGDREYAAVLDACADAVEAGP